MSLEPVWIAGSWRESVASGSFHAENPASGTRHDAEFPISAWPDLDAALTAAAQAAILLRRQPAENIALFLEAYAANIDADAQALAELAASETALAVSPRLRDVEIPRTTTQLRQAAAAAREGSWQHCVIDTRANIRSYLAPIGPVLVLGPNNFPFAFNGIAGGDMAAAIAAGNPVLAKAHPLHPATSQALAQLAAQAIATAGLPPATLQMIYHLGPEDGLRLVADRRLGAVAFTGGRNTGLRLKAAADAAGIPAYLEMSSLNPIVFLPGALAERPEALVKDLADSALAASGQFCTSPNVIFTLAGPATEAFSTALSHTLSERPVAPLLSASGLSSLTESVEALKTAGATVVTGGKLAQGCTRFENTLLRVHGDTFLANPKALQREAFGNATMLVVARDLAQLLELLTLLEGNLTGAIYSSGTGEDDPAYAAVEPLLRRAVGRLLNDKMPTGVALSPAMNHGGPYPATGHPLFTSVGIPRSITRFAALQCFDNVRPQRLPPALRDQAPNPQIWRTVDGSWLQG